MGRSEKETARCAVYRESAKAMPAARKRLGRYQLLYKQKSEYFSKTVYRGVAQLVARLVRDQEAMGSSPVTSTSCGGLLVVATNRKGKNVFPFLLLLIAAPPNGLRAVIPK